MKTDNTRLLIEKIFAKDIEIKLLEGQVQKRIINNTLKMYMYSTEEILQIMNDLLVARELTLQNNP